MPLPNAPTPLSYGAPQLDFSQLGELGNEYYKGAEQRRKYDLARAFQGGIPRKPDGTPDFSSMADVLAKHGEYGGTIPLETQALDRQQLAAVQSGVGGPGPAQQPAAIAPQAPQGAPAPSPPRQQAPGTGDFRSATPAPQNEGAVARNAEGGESLRTLATGLSNNADVSDIIQRYAQVSKLNPDDPLTPEQEAKLKPLLAKSIAARTGAPIGAAPVAPPQAPPATNEAVANLLPPGFTDPKKAVDYLRTAADRILAYGGPHGKALAQQYIDRAKVIEDTAFGAPEGFERAAGGQRPVAGGPKDPAYLASVAEAGVKPTLIPHKIGVDGFGNDIIGSFDPRTGSFYDTSGRKIGSGTGTPAPAKESIIPEKDLELDKKAGRNVEYLQSLEPEQQGLIRKVANYEINPASLSIKGGHRERVLSAVATFDPGYDQKNYLAFSDGLKKFQSGKEGTGVRSFNVGIEHIDQLLELGRALENGDIPKFNELKNWVKTNLGQDAPTNFNGLRAIVGAEIVKAIVGAGGTGEERAAAAKTVSGASTMKQLEGIAKTYGSAMGAQLVGLQRQYEQSTGRKDFDRLLSAQAIRARDSHIGGKPDGANSGLSTTQPAGKAKIIIQNGHTYELQPDGSYK